MGWWVQSNVNAKAARRHHTLNTILNSRSSDIYQKHLGAYSRYVKEGQYIHPKLARWFNHQSEPEFSKVKMPIELRDAANGIMYVVNYFEFLALAIEKKDLDEGLLRECFCGMLPSIEKRAFYLIREAQNKDERYFSAFVNIVEKWSKDGSSIVKQYKSHASVEGIKNLGTPVPSEEDMKLILKGEDICLSYTCYSASGESVNESKQPDLESCSDA
ncbi:hypothetical protein A6K25_09735 [Alteromonas stellipolaris]|uniref:DUF4760 domain-containing protein n=1 Tax=Alteromonas stellipolaris TaxID=233316 RepID=UPI0007B42B3E|nr:DUF4760 domain-containing protein [Alteromonas stellipolaris]ANB21527.1 hypothetical protein A6K25_09735 [Alteromonas stellipolaris]